MTDFDGKEMQEEFNKAFGMIHLEVFPNETPKADITKLTLEQLWWLVKFAKHVRGRCRNNTAFNNYMNRNFSPAKFKEVPKEYEEKRYMGLEIKVGEESLAE